MSLLAIILVALSIIKLIIAYMLNNSDIQEHISIISSTDLKELKNEAVGFLILDGFVGILCGVYIL